MDNIQITPDQFLTSKYFERKLEFVSKLAATVYDRHEAIKKSKSKSASSYAPSSSLSHQNYVVEKMNDSEEDEDEE